MKARYRVTTMGSNGVPCLMEIDPKNVMVSSETIMSIDGSTNNTGVGILRKQDGALFYSIAFTREDKETPVQYKVRLKRAIYDILLTNPMIDTIYYEEPFVGYATAAPNLMMLRTFIEEMIVENEPTFNYINHSEINNMKWKKLFLEPVKCPQGTELQKAAVKEKLVKFLPFLADATQDEIDAISMGFVATVQLRNGSEGDLQSKKKAKPFKFNVRFIGAEDDDTVFQEFSETYNGPQSILENGLKFVELNGKSKFDKKIYEEMGDEDKILIMKFKSQHYGNIILEHRIGHLAATYPYIYALVWRNNRKH